MPASASAPVTQFAPDPAPAPAPVFAPNIPPPPEFAPELIPPLPRDRSALETVRLDPDEVAQMARSPLHTVPMALEQAAPLIEQTRSGVPGEDEPGRQKPARPPGGIRPPTDRSKETTLTKTLVSAQDDVRAALAEAKEVHVDLADASMTPAELSAAPGSDVHVKPFPDMAPGGFRPHAALGDQTFASSDGSAAPRPAVPSMRRAPGTPRWLLPLVAAVSFCVVFAIALGILSLRGTLFGSSRPSASASGGVPQEVPTSAPDVTGAVMAGPASSSSASIASSTPIASPTPIASATSSPAAPSAAPAVSPSEAEARAALTLLGEGITACARDTIGVLPGTSPAVPLALGFLQKGPYASIPRDWSTPVWSCAKFRLETPQQFQIQWQSIKISVEGMGIVWLDENVDGKADRALGFRATLKQRGEPEIGPIEELSPVPPVAPPPR